MRISLIVFLFFTVFNGLGQTTPPKKEKFPSYFGLQIRPILPTRFIGEPKLSLVNDTFTSIFTQKPGYSFGGTVRVGLTKLLAFETGINFNQRNFEVAMSVPDSNVSLTRTMSFISYDIPLNGLVYIQLSERFYMNTSMGLALTMKPSSTKIDSTPGGYTSIYFEHYGVVKSKLGFELNANVGFEFRTEKNGFFYIGGSGRVPFGPLFEARSYYKAQGVNSKQVGNMDGTFLAIDFKYFFPNISNKGPQFQEGPIH